MLWGGTLCSPFPSARITRLDITEALLIDGVQAVLTHEDVPGQNLYGLEHADQPVMAEEIIRYEGEPVAIVAADHPEIVRRALNAIQVEYEEMAPLTDPELAEETDFIHPDGNLIRRIREKFK